MLHHTTYFSQSLSIGTHVCENDQHVLLTLVGHEFSSGKGQARGNDTLDSGGQETKIEERLKGEGS